MNSIPIKALQINLHAFTPILGKLPHSIGAPRWDLAIFISSCVASDGLCSLFRSHVCIVWCGFYSLLIFLSSF